MKNDLLQKYGGAVPRYTSYPTAPHFHDGITAVDYGRWLADIPNGSQLSLYLHVPFCARMCWYCGCHTKIVNRYQPISDYARLLIREIDLLAGAIDGRQVVSHIHWGGGTPTILTSDDMTLLMDHIRTHFLLAENAEIAIEIDPRTLDAEKVSALRRSGINRASLGIQDFNPDIQKAINRVQTFEQTRSVVGWLRDAEINSVSFDLMYGLPGQTTDDVRRTVDLSHSLGPDRLSIFGYAHVPWMKSHQKMIDDAALPDGPDRMRQALAAANQLIHLGYYQIGLDHFARPDDPMATAMKSGVLHRNFQGYTTDGAPTLLGLGSSAIGNLTQGYVQNVSSMGQYSECLEKNEFPVAKGIRLTADDRLRRTIIERLMCDLEIDLADISTEFDTGMSVFKDEMTALSEMAADHLINVKDSRIRITETGRPFVRSICAVFDQYLSTGRGRHSIAV